MSDGAAVLRMESVGVDFGGRRVLDGVDLTVDPGEVVLLAGSSGSGKSTLLLTINGLIPQSIAATVTGTLEVAGHPVATTSTPRLAEHVAVVFQDADSPSVTGTVFEEVCFGAENLCVDATEIERRAENALRAMGLWEQRHADPSRLSGGQRQRLAVAGALAQGTRLLILDEPTANLDPVASDELYALLGGLAVSEPQTAPAIVIVEHDVDLVINIVDRIVVLGSDGRIVDDGPPDLLYAPERLAALRQSGVAVPGPIHAAGLLRELGWQVSQTTEPVELARQVRSDPRPLPVQTGGQPSAEPGEELVGVRGVSVRRGRAMVLTDVNLSVARGSITALIGVNGVGKSTLARTLAGLYRPAAGEIVWAPDVPRGHRAGLVFQNPEHQFVGSTVYNELAHGWRRARLTEEEVAAHVEPLLSLVGLTDMSDQHPFTLSGGQKRRLSVASALGTGTSLLVLDEPTYGQDPHHGARLRRLLLDLHTRGTTIVVVTHDLALVESTATAVALMAGGTVVRSGTALDLLADDEALERAGLRRPAMDRAMSTVPGGSSWWRSVRDGQAES